MKQTQSISHHALPNGRARAHRRTNWRERIFHRSSLFFELKLSSSLRILADMHSDGGGVINNGISGMY